MKEYAKGFYKSKQWLKVSRLYMMQHNYVCERCGGIAVICHHKNYITPANIHDLSITLNPDNLECLCQECHNKEHFQKQSKALFDDSGNMTGVKESAALQEYREARNAIEGIRAQLSTSGQERKGV